MRILQVVSSVDPSSGGPIEGVKQLSVAASQSGHDIQVVSLDEPDSALARDFPFPLNCLGPRLFFYGFTEALVPWLNRNASGYDVVIINGLWQYHSFGTWRALRNSSVPYVIFTHGMLDPWFKKTYPLKHLKKSLYWPWAEYRVLRDASRVLFTSDEERMLARESFSLYRANEEVVNFGTAGPPPDADINSTALYSRFPSLRQKEITLFLGRIHPKKGCDLALQSFARVAKGNANKHLVIAGPDQVGWQPALMKMAYGLGISQQITWTGLLDQQYKWEALFAADVLYLPSHQENFGVVVAEALACGTPVLISNKVNIWREIVADNAGFVADDNLEGAISLLANWERLSIQEKATIRHNTRRCFRERFEISSATTNLIEVLLDVVEKRRRPGAA